MELTNSDLLISLLSFQMSRFPELSTAKRNAPFVSHTDGKQVIQRRLSTDREAGNASEKQDGNRCKKGRITTAF